MEILVPLVTNSHRAQRTLISNNRMGRTWASQNLSIGQHWSAGKCRGDDNTQSQDRLDSEGRSIKSFAKSVYKSPPRRSTKGNPGDKFSQI